MTEQPTELNDAFLAGYERGLEAGTTAGHGAGYAEGLAVLDDAAAALARTAPSKALDWAAARERRATYSTPARTAEEIRAAAARSWGLDVTEKQDEAGAAGRPALTREVAAETAAADLELADDDDWAWRS